MIRRIAFAALMMVTAGCSLVSLKSPEKPLSTRDLNARVLTHEFSARFIVAVGQAADGIAAGADDPAVRSNALRWKIAAAGASRRAASQMAPLLSLLDTWALTVQMSEFLDGGKGKALFGAQQPGAVAISADLAREAEDIARRVTAAQEFEHDQLFIHRYAQAFPIETLDFSRASIVDRWAQDSGGGTKLIDSLGTIPEAMAEAGDLVRMYGDTAPSQMLWQAQLAVQESGLSGKDVQAGLQRLDERLARFSALADSTPKLVQAVAGDVRNQLDGSWERMMSTIHVEGMALAETVKAERQAAMSAVDAQRAAVTADAARIANQIVSDAGDQARRLVREALLLAIVLVTAIFGLPFAAGYFVGRARRR